MSVSTPLSGISPTPAWSFQERRLVRPKLPDLSEISYSILIKWNGWGQLISFVLSHPLYDLLCDYALYSSSKMTYLRLLNPCSISKAAGGAGVAAGR